jgi:hypothetical protein
MERRGYSTNDIVKIVATNSTAASDVCPSRTHKSTITDLFQDVLYRGTVSDTSILLGKKGIKEVTRNHTSANSQLGRVVHAHLSLTKGGGSAPGLYSEGEKASSIKPSEATLTPHINRCT